MKLSLIACAAVVFALAIQAQESNQQLYIVTHVDTLGGEKAAEAAKLLQQYVADTRKDSGAVRIELARETNRVNHFVLVEIWRTRKDFDAHLDRSHTVDFRNKIQPILGGPFDERMHYLLP